MLLGLIRCLCKCLFCSRKTYAENICLVNSASTLLKLSKVFIPISKAARLKIAFASPVEVLYWHFGHLRPWIVYLSRQATLQMVHLFIWGGWSHRILSYCHQGCYDICMHLPCVSTNSSDLSRSMIGFTRGACLLIFFLATCMLNDFARKRMCR